MIQRVGAAGGPAADGGTERLRAASRRLEGVFVQQLFKAMRETVPGGGIVDGGAGEETFTGLLDEHVAGEAAERGAMGGEALFRQLQGLRGGAAAGQVAP